MRNWMVDLREAKRKTIEDMAIICKCSRKLLHIVECGSITHPKIAADIARAYGMTTDQYNMLVDERHKAKAIPVFREPRKHFSLYSGGAL